MAKHVILIGGGDYRKRENGEIDEYLKTIITPEMTVLIVPFASEASKHISWAAALYTNFKEHGIDRFSILDPALPDDVVLERINGADVLFLVGGLPDVLIEALRRKGALDAVRNHPGIIIGYSAGALALSEECVILPEPGHPSTEIVRGIGVVPFSTYVHYNESHDGPLSKLSLARDIFAISDRGAIVIAGNHTAYIGKVFKFHRGTKSLVSR